MGVYEEKILPLIKQAEGNRYAGHVEAARALYNQALALAPDEEFATLGLGNCDRMDGNLAAALALHERARDLYPHSIWPNVELAEDYFTQGQLEAAETCWRAVLAINPAQYNALMGLVRLARARGDQEGALAALVNLPEQSPELLLERAGLLAGLDRLEEALAVLRDGAEQYPNNPRFLVEAALIWRERGDVTTASRLLEAAAVRDPRNPVALLKLSDLARQLGDYEAALAYLAEAGEKCDPDIWVDLCTAQVMFELGQYEACDARLAEAVQRFGPQPLISKIHAELLARGGRVREARDMIATAWRNGGGDDSLVLLEAELANRAGDTARAAILAAALSPAPPLILADQLFLQALLAEDAWDSKAADLFQAVLHAKPDHRGAISALVHLALLGGELNVARERLARLALLEMPDRRARGLSANVSQSFLGQYFDEHAVEPEGMEMIHEQAAKPAALRLARLRELSDSLPYWTPAAAALLLAMRQAGLLAHSDAHNRDGEPVIPRRIMQYWNTIPPADIATLMRSCAGGAPRLGIPLL